MSTSPPRRRSKSRSPKRSSPASSNRRPLHERSYSELNEVARRSTDNGTDQKMYAKTAFPQLPSQFFPPAGGQPFIFEDNTAGPSDAPIVPSRSPLRRHNSTSSAGSSGKENNVGDQPRPRKSRSSTFHSKRSAGSMASPSAGDELPSSRPSIGSFLDDPSDDSPIDQTDLNPPPGRVFAPQHESTTVGPAEVRPRTGSMPSTSEALSPLSLRNEDAAQTTGFRPVPRLKNPKRLRSQSSTSTRSDSVPPGTSSSALGSDGRPRSASNPPNADMLLQELIEGGANVQYPRLKKPSATSLRTNTSSTRAAYPAPLRLQRKRANSHLREAASAAESEASSSKQHPRLYPSKSYNSVMSGTSSVNLPYKGQVEGQVPTSARSSDEADDFVAELHPQLSKPQLPTVHGGEFANESRPTTNGSSKSRPGSFYRFLNDSYTSWARFYYRGEGKLRLDTPPRVTDVQQPSTPVRRLNSSTNASGPSQSPPSAGFPDQIYIPRARPRQNDAASIAGSDNTDSITALPPVTASTNHTHAESFNRTPELPHLSPDKRSGLHFREWQAPSFDSDTSTFSRTNRQIILFCVGFLFPFAWMMASLLPIPPRPQMRSVGLEGEYTEKEHTMIDLFNDVDKKRYQKARWWRNLNRWMSLTGICVIAAIIACAVVATQ